MALGRDLEVDVRRSPEMLADGREVAPDRTLGGNRVGLRDHRLELVVARLRDAEAAAEVELGLALVPDVVAAAGPGLPDVEDRVAQRRAVRRRDLAADEEDLAVLAALVVLVDLDRRLAPRRVLHVERALHVARGGGVVVVVRQRVDQHGRARDVREQDELVGPADVRQERQHRAPLLLGDAMAPEHLVDGLERLGHDLREPISGLCRRRHVASSRFFHCAEPASHSVYVYGLARILVSGIAGCMPAVHCSSPSSRVANSTVSSTARRAAPRSIPTSAWRCFTRRPSTRTLWTSARWAWNATWPYGWRTGNMTGELSFLIRTTSAFLPASRLPISESSPSALLPPRVAQSTTCSARRWWLVTVSPLACASRCSRERSAPSVE